MGTAARSDWMAAVLLTKLVKERLGVDVDPVKLMNFIIDEWDTISGWTHAIHDAQQKPADGEVGEVSTDG